VNTGSAGGTGGKPRASEVTDQQARAIGIDFSPYSSQTSLLYTVRRRRDGCDDKSAGEPPALPVSEILYLFEQTLIRLTECVEGAPVEA
jgi:hypothetical protein